MHRLIPCLTIYKNKLINTINFEIENSKYIGDPLNAVRFLTKKSRRNYYFRYSATINNTPPQLIL